MRKIWISICSEHQKHQRDCARCKTGQYVDVELLNLNQWVFKRFPKLWKWLANF